jgi:hypothetical protein
MAALIECMHELEATPGTTGTSDLNYCAAVAVQEASLPLCGRSIFSSAALQLTFCLHGDASGLGGCFEECFSDFEEAACAY